MTGKGNQRLRQAALAALCGLLLVSAAGCVRTVLPDSSFLDGLEPAEDPVLLRHPFGGRNRARFEELVEAYNRTAGAGHPVKAVAAPPREAGLESDGAIIIRPGRYPLKETTLKGSAGTEPGLEPYLFHEKYGIAEREDFFLWQLFVVEGRQRRARVQADIPLFYAPAVQVLPAGSAGSALAEGASAPFFGAGHMERLYALLAADSVPPFSVPYHALPALGRSLRRLNPELLGHAAVALAGSGTVGSGTVGSGTDGSGGSGQTAGRDGSGGLVWAGRIETPEPARALSVWLFYRWLAGRERQEQAFSFGLLPVRRSLLRNAEPGSSGPAPETGEESGGGAADSEARTLENLNGLVRKKWNTIREDLL